MSSFSNGRLPGWTAAILGAALTVAAHGQGTAGSGGATGASRQGITPATPSFQGGARSVYLGPDCNFNGVDDFLELQGNDCQPDGVPDDCQVFGNDCDQNGIPDECELDCDFDGIPDDCEIGTDCNVNGVPDHCEMSEPMSFQFTGGFPDNPVLPRHDPGFGLLNGVLLESELSLVVTFPIENTNPFPATMAFFCHWTQRFSLSGLDVLEGEVQSGEVEVMLPAFDGTLDFRGPSGASITSETLSNGIGELFVPPFAPELLGFVGPEGNPGTVDIANFFSLGCGFLDALGFEIMFGGFASASSYTVTVTYFIGVDCNQNGVLDECELDPDCNANGVPDGCELEGNDDNGNGIPDECE